MEYQKTIGPRSWADLLLLALIWGGTFVAVGIGLREIGVLTLVAFRVLGGAIVLWIYVFAKGLQIPKKPSVWGAFLIMGLLNNVIPFSLITWGQTYTEAGLAAILNGSTAIFGVLVAAMVFADEKLSRSKVIGVTLGFVGVATAMGLSHLGQFNLTSLAQLAILGASISYAFAGAWGRSKLQRLSPQVAAAGMTGFSGAIMAGLALSIEGGPTMNYSAPIWVALIYLAAAATALAYLLYYRILAAAGSGNLLLVTLLIPPVAIGLGALMLGENLTNQAILGFVILAFGLIILDGRALRAVSRKNQSQRQP